MKSITPEEYHKYIEKIGLCHSFYIGDSKFYKDLSESIKSNEWNSLDDTTNLELYMYISLGQVGHYLDHCRGNYSYAFFDEKLKLLNEIMKLDETQSLEIVNYVLELLQESEIEIKPSLLKASESNQMGNRCEIMNQNRYTHPKFKDYQLNFDSWGSTTIRKSIESLKNDVVQPN